MHDVEIRRGIVDRVLARRGRYHLFESLDPAATAFVVIDMQGMFLAPGAPAEVPVARAIVGNINALTKKLRKIGVLVCWVTHANIRTPKGSDWDGFFNNFVSAETRRKTIDNLSMPGAGQQLWEDIEVEKGDLHLTKNRYSALIPGASHLERLLRSNGIRNVLIAGTKTNVCCEATGRNAMNLDFNTVMISNCLAALSDEEHRATLETFIQQFGDVMTSEEVFSVLKRRPNMDIAE